MKILSMQVFDPIFHPNGTAIPPRIEMLVEEVDLDKPDLVQSFGEWIVEYHGEFILFYHSGELASRYIIDGDGDEVETFFEGNLNTRTHITMPVFPVTVATRDKAGGWREMFAPVSMVDSWLEKLRNENANGHWELQPSGTAARRGMILFELVYRVPRTSDQDSDARAKAARKPRK